MNAALENENVPVIEMRGVSVGSLTAPETVRVGQVNWSVAAGDFWVVGGLHGAGKGDLLALAGGQMAPAGGEYFLFGEPMPIFEGGRLATRLRVGFVFEDGKLLNHLTVRENVALPLRYHKNLPDSQANELAALVLQSTGLEEWADSTPGAMARPWRRRAALARALVLQPDLLLLENPLSGLDSRERAWWLNFLGELSKGGAASGGKSVTLVAGVDDFRPWRNLARQFAILENKRFTVLGGWQQLAAASDELVRELALEQTA